MTLPLIMYGIKSCDTIRKARGWLDGRGIAYEFHDYKTAGLERERLQRWCRELGWETVLNRAGTTFRKLPQSQKQDLDENRVIDLMLAQPSMIKRPMLEGGKRLVVGFRPEDYEQIAQEAR